MRKPQGAIILKRSLVERGTWYRKHDSKMQFVSYRQQYHEKNRYKKGMWETSDGTPNCVTPQKRIIGSSTKAICDKTHFSVCSSETGAESTTTAENYVFFISFRCPLTKMICFICALLASSIQKTNKHDI